ncbi:TPA: hypothetical protein IAA86_00085 [Candidatus Galligastranaerophilus intestinavium]|uniref:Class III signal peptide-containing protein n=1 Tax=Candidatus Galligastranaerophilus intestinavium TaxID=2840836 RepID=A0A9D1JXU1_9BACT|nr:hypothetical protein [Candidatus Galligastranaerophilus faecipullorum]HIS73403.1 hypothetical protein [Candidatus Galligastranaerophilus intestinavium]
MKQAQSILEFTIIVAFVLIFISIFLNSFKLKGIEQQATYGVSESGTNTVVVPPMTP